MLKIDCEYKIKEDIGFIMEAEAVNSVELAERTMVSRTTLDTIVKKGKARDDVCEKIYSYAYRNRYRINSVKEELLKEKYGAVLFHGSKHGLTEVTSFGSRKSCDFGNGFYLGETYDQALSFVCDVEHSSIYSFRYSLDKLNVLWLDCNMEWMLAICYYRGTLKTYASNQQVQDIVSKIENADVISAPIADNKMFYIMAQFTDGEINADAALHSLSASNLGRQYIFKTEKALNNLIPVEKYYLCTPEREACRKTLIERGYEIDTKLKLAKREYREGLYIEELLK